MLRIPITYFLTVLTCPHGMKFQKWSPQWSHTEEFEDIYTDITLRNQRFSWFNNEFHNHSIRVRHASKRSMYSSSRGKYCICIRNKLKAQSLFFCVRTLLMFFLVLTLNLIKVILFFHPRPIVSERNELFIQFLSDLSLTADGFIGHYKFRPKKLPTTTVPPTTTTIPATSGKFFLALFDCKTDLFQKERVRKM